MKIIFLDIDGVMNSYRQFKSIEKRRSVRVAISPSDYKMVDPLDKGCIKNLNTVINETGAFLVLSSSWRKGSEEKFIAIINFFLSSGVVGRFIGRTETMHNHQRGDEIKQWLDKHQGFVSSYVVLDDDSDMDAVKDNFIKIDNEFGLSEENAQEAIKILNKVQ